MSTGRGDIADQVCFDLLKDKKIATYTASDLTQKVLELTDETAKKLKGELESQTRFFVTGKKTANAADGLASFEVSVLDIDDKEYKAKRGVSPVNGLYSGGSGSRLVIPAFERDMEQGIELYPANPLEAMLFCFTKGLKADQDLGVNNKLQYGFVSPQTVRMLMPPGISFSYQDGNELFTELTGIKFDFSDKMPRSRKVELAQAIRGVEAFYHVLETQFLRLDNAQVAANAAHSRLKNSKGHFTTYRQRLKDIGKERQYTQPLIDAFMKGKLPEIVAATKEFQEREQQTFDNALKVGPKI